MSDSEQGPQLSGVGGLVRQWVTKQTAARAGVTVLAVSGSQGIGKTTALKEVTDLPGLRIAVLSLDDFYLTQKERLSLAKTVHPLCATRGAPGTHDVALLLHTIEALCAAGAEDEIRWPAFDKVSDDRAPLEAGRHFVGRPDAILVEGWMIGALADPQAGQSAPINPLEEHEDPDGIWRNWQEQALAQAYMPLWTRMDTFLHLLAPDFDTVLGWRCEQEETTLGLAKGTLPDERRAWVERFIQYYERITRRMLCGARVEGDVIAVDEHRRPQTNRIMPVP